MKATLRRVASLTPGQRGAMFELFGRCFDGTRRQRFEADLEDKNRVLLLADDEGALAGFSTLAFYRTAAGGEPINVVCSGDTLVDPAAWGTSVLAPAWIAAVKRLDRERPAARLLWLLLTSGYRTYRFLPVFWRQFHPRHDGAAPTAHRRLRENLAAERFGDAYDPATGIVRFAEPQVLVPELRGIPAARLANPHVAFFAAANPGHEAGDELVCLTELSDSNLTAAGRRMVRRGEQCLVAEPRGEAA